MILNSTQAALGLLSPFIIKPLIQYIQDGKNAWVGTIDFFDLSQKAPWLAYFTPERQYGLSLTLILILT